MPGCKESMWTMCVQIRTAYLQSHSSKLGAGIAQSVYRRLPTGWTTEASEFEFRWG
jgi:hypothetical protein